MSPTIKKVGIGAVVILALFFGYNMLFGGASSDLLVTVDAPSPETQEFLLRLQKLQSITTDTALFSDPRFISLEDRRQAIPDEPTGRTNPFLPTP